jgi:methionyl-tRNA formyltransferase
MLNYPYADGDLLEQRNTYFYSRYEGRAFLAAWCRQRAGVAALPAEDAPEAATGSRPTDRLLDDLRVDISARLIDTGGRQTLDRLVQRFEVSKRLHGEYGADWRPVDPADYHTLERYLCFGEVLELAWTTWAALPYLNALLKCLDTLTALAGRLNVGQRVRLESLIGREEMHVAALAKRVGLKEIRHDD